MQKRDPKTNTGICVLEMTRRLGYKSIGSGISFKRAKRTIYQLGVVVEIEFAGSFGIVHAEKGSE